MKFLGNDFSRVRICPSVCRDGKLHLVMGKKATSSSRLASTDKIERRRGKKYTDIFVYVISRILRAFDPIFHRASLKVVILP